MKILIFGGTTEGRNLSLALASEGADVTVSVVSELGTEELNKFLEESRPERGSLTIAQGPKDVDDICAMLEGVDLCVDATHPYAVIVTDNIRQAADRMGMELLRVTRAEADETACSDAGVILAADPADAAEKAKALGGRVLLTTGSKDLPTYGKLLDPELLYPRVLPLSQSIESCENAGIPHRNIIAIQGPFSEELNKAIINEYNITVLITKESGKAGGFGEKICACQSCGIPAIVIARPEEEGLTYEEVLAYCREKLKKEING